MADAYRSGISDADIMAHSDAIRREVEESQPLVGEVVDASTLIPDYEDNPAFLPKIQALSSLLSGIRKNRGDGNCFYRSFLISLGERFLAAKVQPPGTLTGEPSVLQSKYEELIKYVSASADKLIALGYPDFTIPDFHETMLAFLNSLSEAGASQASLLAQFTDKMNGLYIITYMRCLCRCVLNCMLRRTIHFCAMCVYGERRLPTCCFLPYLRYSSYRHHVRKLCVNGDGCCSYARARFSTACQLQRLLSICFTNTS